jgi:hypothetical protein
MALGLDLGSIDTKRMEKEMSQYYGYGVLHNSMINAFSMPSVTISGTYSYGTSNKSNEKKEKEVKKVNPYIPEKVVFYRRSEGTVTAKFTWPNGFKNQVTCSKDDVFTPEGAYMAALAEMVLGGKKEYKRIYQIVDRRMKPAIKKLNANVVNQLSVNKTRKKFDKNK